MAPAGATAATTKVSGVDSWGVRIVNVTTGFVHRGAVRNAERALAEIRAQAAASSWTRAYFEQRHDLPQRQAR